MSASICIVMLVSVIFMHLLPLQFYAILSKLSTAMTGSANLMLMGAFSYLTEITKEEDRTFR